MTVDPDTPPLRVVVVDDHPVFRRGLGALLAEEGVDVLAEAGTATDGIAAVAALHPDVVVLDLHLPDSSGVAATRVLVRDHPATRVLVLTMDGGDTAALAALRVGARGYLLKEAAAESIGRAIATVASGQLVLDAALAGRLGAVLGASAAVSHGQGGLDDLSKRELEVLLLVAEGLGNAEIGRRLFLAEKTVRNNVTALLAKTAAGSRPALIAWARDRLRPSERPGT